MAAALWYPMMGDRPVTIYTENTPVAGEACQAIMRWGQVPITEESHEDRRVGCPGHRRQPRPRPGVCAGAGRPGAAKVYGAARNPAAVTEPGVTPVALDITDPDRVAQAALDAVEAGQIEVLADERTRTVKAELSRDHELIYPPVQEFWDAAVSGTP
jgi:hypothetical protein